MAPPTRTVILDCDGVIFDSNELKTEAFRRVLAPYPPEAVDRFLDNHRRTGGVSRFVKLRRFLAELSGREAREEVLADLLAAYGRACEALYREADFTPGVPEILATLAEDAVLFVASGGAEDELRRVFRQRGIDRHFRAIFGSPRPKDACVAEALKAAPDPGRAVMVGDSESDFQAARKAGIPFVYMARFAENPRRMEALAARHGFAAIDNLTEWRWDHA